MNHQDFLVLGSGVAGLMFALDAAEHGTVTVITKNRPDEGNTRYAQGGIASVIDPLDSLEAHGSDTLIAGAGLCNEAIVRMAVAEGPQVIRRLVELGTEFDRSEVSAEFELGRFDLGQEGGHSARRILHSRDQTGAEIHRAVLAKAESHPRIKILPYHTAIDLITERDLLGSARTDTSQRREVFGAYVFDQEKHQVVEFVSRVTVIATGGVGKVYLYTSNPDVATGDGVAMAYRAGARIANMEFIQFHPTCLYHPQAKSFLITEALRGEGARLKDLSGYEFMRDYDERGELAPRDIVARAIDAQVKKTGADYVYLDISHLQSSFIKERFPTIYETTKEFGFDMTKGPLPVVPAAHYCCGGVVTDEWGQSDIARLYVCGEAACTGLHGANRLASNSLLEAAVFGARAAKDAASKLPTLEVPTEIAKWDYLDTKMSEEAVIVSHTWDEVRRLMWNLVGIVRSDRRLDFARNRLEYIKREIRDYYWRFSITADLLELRNIIDVAELIVRCARERRESRGLHYNVDCPARDDEHWHRDTIITIDDA